MDPTTLSDLSTRSRQLIERLVKNPEEFLSQLYQYQRGTLTEHFPYNLLDLKVVRSDYLLINHPVLACLAGQPVEQSIHQIKDSPTAICLHRTVKPLDDQGKQSQTLLVTVGQETLNQKGKPRYERTNYVVKIINVDLPFIKVVNRPDNIPNWINDPIQHKWMANILNCHWVDLDQFTSETLFLQIAGILQQQEPNLNGIMNQIGSTILSKSEGQRNFDGVILMDYASWGNLESFIENPLNPYLEEKIFYDEMGQIQQKKIWKSEAITGLIKQLLANLTCLQEYIQLSHTDLKCRNLVVADQVNRQTDYRGLKWFTTFTLKLIDFSLATIILQTDKGPLRLMHRNILSNINYLTNPIEYHPDPEQPYFRLTGNFLSVLGYIRYAGTASLYSFDLYTFLVDLYSHDQIFYGIMSDPVLKQKLWDPLWFPEEEAIMYIRVRRAKSQGKIFAELIDLILDVKLRPNLMELLWEQLRETPNS